MRTLEFSSLSDYDRACLVAKYNSLYKKETIDPKIYENRTEAEIKYLRRTMGTTKQFSCGLEFSKEFAEYPDYEHFNFVMMAHHVFDKSGTLPFSGPLSEQPSQFMEILEVLFELDSEREADIRRKAEQDKSKNVKRR